MKNVNLEEFKGPLYLSVNSNVTFSVRPFPRRQSRLTKFLLTYVLTREIVLVPNILVMFFYFIEATDKYKKRELLRL